MVQVSGAENVILIYRAAFRRDRNLCGLNTARGIIAGNSRVLCLSHISHILKHIYTLCLMGN